MKILPFLIFVFGAHFLVFLVSKITLTYICVGMMFPVILLAVYFLMKLPRWLSAIIILLVIGLNVAKIVNGGPSIFKVQPGMNLNDELKVVEKTYEIANGREFSINTVTNPYLVPTLWEYHFYHYASLNNVFLPFYRGITAYSFVGDKLLPRNDQKRPVEFLITEQGVGAANSWSNQLIDSEKHGRTLKETLAIGGFTLYVLEPDMPN